MYGAVWSGAVNQRRSLVVSMISGLVNAMKAFMSTVLPLVLALLIGYIAGTGVEGNRWQVRWSERDAADAIATLQESERLRARESQQEIERDNQNRLNAANSRAADARAVSDRLHAEIRKLETRLNAERETGKLARAAGEQQTGGAPRLVCAELFSRIDERAGRLAEYADRARIRGQSCERQYNAVTGY